METIEIELGFRDIDIILDGLNFTYEKVVRLLAKKYNLTEVLSAIIINDLSESLSSVKVLDAFAMNNLAGRKPKIKFEFSLDEVSAIQCALIACKFFTHNVTEGRPFNTSFEYVKAGRYLIEAFNVESGGMLRELSDW